MPTKDNLEEYPVFTTDDCPNKLIKFLDGKAIARDDVLSEQLHDYHLEVLSIKQTVVNVSMFMKLGAVALIIILGLVLKGCC